MKILLLIPFLLLFVTPVYAQLLSDATGLVTRLDVKTSGHVFEVKTVSNFNIQDYDFDKEQKRLRLFIDSGLENNLGEIIIPKKLLSGNFTFFLNDEAYTPKVHTNDKVSFITLNFTGSGPNKIEIFGTISLPDIAEPIDNSVEESTKTESESGGGCLIATATYGSESAPQVQNLREIRDTIVMNTDSGKTFMALFNQVYYSFSPAIADYQRENPLFKEVVKTGLTPLLSSLTLLNYVELNSESSVLVYGISLILLNLGMYVGLPIGTVYFIGKKF